MKKIIYAALFLFQSSLMAQTVSLVSPLSSWKYLANGSNQGTAWRASAFNDATWLAGNAQLGYGDGDEATVVSFGPSSTAKYITTYFRKSIINFRKSILISSWMQNFSNPLPSLKFKYHFTNITISILK